MLDFFPVLRMQRLENIVIFQPWYNGERLGRSMSVDLKTGTTQTVDHKDVTTNFTLAFGILGMMRFDSTAALVVIKDARKCANLRGYPVFAITKTEIVTASGVQIPSQERTMLRLLKASVDPKYHGRGMFYSAGGNITLTMQKDEETDAQATAWERTDPLFTWNRHLALPLLGA